MKKIITTLLVLSVSLFSLIAQNSRHEKGNFSIDAGLGISGSGSSREIPPIMIDADYTFLAFGAGSLSAGVYFSFDASDSSNYILVGPMVNVRCSLGDHFDIYAKSIIGYKHYYSHNSIGFGQNLGATWYFSPKLGVGTEIGYGGPTLFGVHMTFKF